MFFIPVLIELSSCKWVSRNNRLLKTISAVLGIISCISFPIFMMDGYIFDLRLAVFTTAGLYGGISTSFILAGVIVFYRFLVGGIGAYATVIVVIIVLIFMIYFTKLFHQSSRPKKVIIGSSVAVIGAIVSLVNSAVLFGASFSISFVIMFILLTLCTTALIIYLYEVIMESLWIKIKAEKMQIVSHLASSVSHEVRNPLTVVRGFLQMMQQEELPEKQRKEFLKISIEEVDRANEIIKNYLTFAKPSPNKLEIINMKDELHKTIQMITPLANLNAVNIDTDIKDFFIKADGQLIQQCLLNITKNCIEAMPDSGHLSIKTKKEDDFLILSISDNGIGMSKEDLTRLGEPYFTTKGREGTGLGMMAVFNIIEMMDGQLEVTSKVNEGTNFCIRFRLAEEQIL